MAKDKPGIKYFSQDSDHVHNKKVKLLFNEFDSHGPWIWECLKCEIYAKKGYYFDLNDPDELIIFASDVAKKPVSLVKEIIAGCIRRGLFDKPVFDAFNVLTSDRIQTNYLDGNREKRKKGPAVIDLIKEYLLIEIGDHEKRIDIISIKNKNYREKIEKYRENSDYSREKVDKENEIKENEIKENEREIKNKDFTPPIVDEVLIFFKEKVFTTKWSEGKCSTEAQNFIDYYARTDWHTRNGPIINWQNAANGWITSDRKFAESKKGKSSGGAMPDSWNQKYADTLDGPNWSSYLQHLYSLGLKPVKDRFEKIIDFVKSENIIPDHDKSTDWKTELAAKIGKEKV